MPAPRPITERPISRGTPSPYGKNAGAHQAFTSYVNETGGRYTEPGWKNFLTNYNALGGGQPTQALGSVGGGGSSGGGGGGGGRRGGGGGGGGASSAMTQAMFDAALGVLGQKPPQLQLQQTQLPAFQGQNIAAFNPAVYNQARQQLAAAVAADRAAINQGAAQTTQALNNNFQNSYAQAQGQVQPGVEPVQGAALAANAGVSTAPMAQQNQALAQNSQAGFQNLLAVLAANANQSQQSRLNQVALDQQTALRNVGTQNTALGGQIGMAQTQGYQQWLQRDEERRNQNNMLQQQWNREGLMRNQDLENEQRTTNYTTQNQLITQRLQPLLDLIMSTQGTNINTAALMKLIGG